VRSVVLDRWDMEHINFMKLKGNHRVNQLWEAYARQNASTFPLLNPSSTRYESTGLLLSSYLQCREERETFIKNKYASLPEWIMRDGQ